MAAARRLASSDGRHRARSSPGTRCSRPAAPTGGSCARPARARARRVARAAARRPAPRAARRRCARAGHRAALRRTRPRRCKRRLGGPDDRHDRHRVGQVAVLQPADARRPAAATPKARALYLYPTKALAQDQARALHALGLHKQVRPAIYDGDTPRERARGDPPAREPRPHEPRHAARRDPPQPPRVGATSSPNLAVVVVDEAHVYRGVFGSHVANVLRRLRRIAAAYGTEPRFLLAQRDDRQPGRARRAADGPGRVRARRPRRLAAARGARSRCGTRR